MICACLNQCRIPESPVQVISQEEGEKFYPWAVMLKNKNHIRRDAHPQKYVHKQAYAMYVNFSWMCVP